MPGVVLVLDDVVARCLLLQSAYRSLLFPLWFFQILPPSFPSCLGVSKETGCCLETSVCREPKEKKLREKRTTLLSSACEYWEGSSSNSTESGKAHRPGHGEKEAREQK